MPFGFTQVFGVAVRERANVAWQNGRCFGSGHYVPIAATANFSSFRAVGFVLPFCAESYLDEIVCERKLIESLRRAIGFGISSRRA